MLISKSGSQSFSMQMKWELEKVSLPFGDEKKEWMLSNRKKTSLYMEDFVLLPYLSLAPLSYQK